MKIGLNRESIILVVCLLLGACSKVEQGEYSRSSQSGKQSFGYVENNIGACMSFFDLALRLNAYLELPEEQRDEWQESYFPGYRIEQDEAGSWMGLKGEDTVFTVHPDQLTLTTESAVWELDGCCEAYHGVLRITCTELRYWMLDVISVVNGAWTTEARLKVKYQGTEIPDNFNVGDWEISGSGKSILTETADSCQTELRFDLSAPVAKVADSKYLFHEGTVFMALKDSERQREEMVKAELRLLPDKGRKLQIYYMGNIYSYRDEPEFILNKDK